jgi:hypothetical protein
LGSLVYVSLKAHTSETNIQDRDAGEVGTGAATRARGGEGLGCEASVVALSYGAEAALRHGCGGDFIAALGGTDRGLGTRQVRKGAGWWGGQIPTRGRRASQIGCGVREVRRRRQVQSTITTFLGEEGISLRLCDG